MPRGPDSKSETILKRNGEREKQDRERQEEEHFNKEKIHEESSLVPPEEPLKEETGDGGSAPLSRSSRAADRTTVPAEPKSVLDPEYLEGLPDWAEPVAVINVSDGDTLNVQRGDGSQWYVRLLECNTPESGAAKRVGYASASSYGKMASEYTKSLISPGDVVYLSRDLETDGKESSDLDKYGRLLRIVWLVLPGNDWNRDDEKVTENTLNGMLLSGGMAEAVFYDDFGYQELFTRLADEARQKERGLWKYPDAFRKEGI
ncbi:MAG: thermonuclease family protein [Lachnospiraceae bacterium]|nr:thermonuclease family protein [Lachnospiraceae bacterium]